MLTALTALVCGHRIAELNYQHTIVKFREHKNLADRQRALLCWVTGVF